MKLFWARGYVASSLAQLLRAMGIARSSFYASFGDKRRLFIECLDLFEARTLDILHGENIEAAPETAAAVFFEQTLFTVSNKRCQHGCMMVNAILELADVDPPLSRMATEKLNNIESRFSALFTAAQQQQRLPATQPPASLARYVMNVNQGLRVQSRKGVPRSELREIVAVSLAMAGLAANEPPTRTAANETN